MAERHSKRPREEKEEEEEEEEEEETHLEQEDLLLSGVEISKRHKNSYNHILAILDDKTEEELQHEQLAQESNQDLSDFFSALQQELSSSDPLPEPEPYNSSSSSLNPCVKEESDEERVIRHLLEASDDELGIPNRVEDSGGDVVGGDNEILDGDGGVGDYSFAFCDGLWELEDEAANYHTLLQSQLFM